MSISLNVKTTVYDRYAISRKFTQIETEIKRGNASLSFIVSSEELTELKNGSKTMYTRLGLMDITCSDITMALSKSEFGTMAGVIATIKTEQASIAINTQQIALKVSKGNVSSQLSVETGQVAISSNRLVVSATNLSISADGTLNAKNGIFSGTVNASLGTIGGWNITATDVYDNSAASACAGIGKNGSTFAFWAGSTFANRNNAPFRVGHDGSLYAENATLVCSDLIADSGTFKGAITSNWIELSGDMVLQSDPHAYFVLRDYQYDRNINFSEYSAFCFDSSDMGKQARVSCEATYAEVNALSGGVISSVGSNYTLTTRVNTTSRATEKTKIRKYESTALSRVMSCDVYQYNLKCDMEHENIGFVIGDGFQVDESIINRDVGGVNIYSAVALAYKAIQELCERKEQVQQKIIEAQRLVVLLEQQVGL